MRFFSSASSLILIGSLLPALTAQTGPINFTYATWSKATSSTATSPGSASGTLVIGTQTVNVTYSGDVAAVNDYPSLTEVGSGATYDYWLPVSTFTNSTVANVPANYSLIGLDENPGFTNTITFSSPVVNPILDILSLGNGGSTITYIFSSTPVLLGQGAQNNFGGCSTCLVLHGNSLAGTEGDGVVEFVGTFSSISWTTSGTSDENGFTVGVQAFAPPTQTTTSVTLNLTAPSIGANIANVWNVAETGSAGPLGYATLYITSSQPKSNGAPQAPVQVTVGLYFDQLDNISASFTENNVNFASPETFTLTGGTITGGSGAYAGATGSLSLTFVQGANSVYTTTGTGSVTVGGKTTPLNLTNFNGSSVSNAQEYFSSGAASGTASPLGNATAIIKIDNSNTPPEPSIGTVTVSLNSTDSFILYFSDSSLSANGASFPATVAGGTGAYAGATGSFMLALGSSAGAYTIQGTGTITTAAAGVPIITSVKTAFGASVVGYNTWLQINGTNLAPSNTASGGVVWSSAPSFAQNEMPAQLGPISVTVDGLPGYIFFYCSAATDTACTAGDQINVLAPLDTNNVPYPVEVIVTNNGVSSAPFTVLNNGLSPTFPLFDATGHVVARHLNYNLLGPATLFPGSSTPAAAGETIIVVLYGLGPPSGTAPTAGSATQSGSLPSAPQCWISGVPAAVVVYALISPGLYQLNLTVPQSTPSGDNPISCNYQGYPTFPGTLIAVQ